MLPSDIISRVERTLFDTTNVRWPEDELLDYINDAQQAIVLARPDANSKNGPLLLVAGTRQTIPSTPGAIGVRFLRLTRNLGSNGTTAGPAIRESSRVALDSELQNWHALANASTTVKHYVYDNVDPKTFYVYPPVPGTHGSASTPSVFVEIIYSALPAILTTIADTYTLPGFGTFPNTLTLPDQYLNAVIDWVLYRCYSKDASYAGNLQRAQYHANAFASQLGIAMQTGFMAASSQQATPTPAAAPQIRTGS